MHNITVGGITLFYVTPTRNMKGWIVHGGYLIESYEDAFMYARKANNLFMKGTQYDRAS